MMFKQRMIRSLAASAVVTLLVMSMIGSAMAETENEAFRAAVEEIFATYSAANMNGDADLYISLWDENGIQMGPNKPAVFGKSTIGEGKRKMLQKTEYESQIIKVEEVQVAGDWGFARGTFTGSVKPKAGGATTNVDGKYLTIFKKQADGSWKIFRDCFNFNVPPK